MDVRTMITGLLLGGIGFAWADSTPGSAIAPSRLKCRTFQTDAGAEIDTRDATAEVGQWVIELEDRGWTVHDVDWEIGQKPTGFPQGYTHVCMTPVKI